MTRNKTPPLIGKLIVSGSRSCSCSCSLEMGTSPRTPFEFKILSPRGVINSHVTGVGLGIVAALEKSTIPSNPPIIPPTNTHTDHSHTTGFEQQQQQQQEEEYTIVTCRKPNKSYTRIIYQGGSCLYDYDYHGGIQIRRHHQQQQQQQQQQPQPGGTSKSREISPSLSPAPGGATVVLQAPDSDSDYGFDFDLDLTSCGLCKRKLHGKDIYMYRGERAFCSQECRYRQIAKDETREKHCGREATSSLYLSTTSADDSNPTSSSPYPSPSPGQMFSTGIFAI